jgi:type II secretory pathway component GspD/PulD (secretin)
MVLALALLSLTLVASAQSTDVKSSESDCSRLSNHMDKANCTAAHSEVRTIYLKNVATQNDANEIMVAIRNSFDPELRIYLLRDPNALVVTTYPEEFARIEALVRTLDRPRKTYRLTYTITELDADKPIGTEHLSMIVLDGQMTSVKEGDKIPVATGSYSDGNTSPNGVQTQFTYLDVGMNFQATVNEVEGGALLKTKVEQSSLGQPSTIAGVQEPVVRQTVFDGISVLTLNKPVMLGSIDVPNTTRRLDIAVVLEQVK